MSQRRSRFELYVDILDAIHRGHRKPTKIMHQANMSWIPLSEMLDSLREQELITSKSVNIKDKRTKALYTITRKGLNVLEYYRRSLELVNLNRIRG